MVSNVIQICSPPSCVFLWALPSLEVHFLLEPLEGTVTGLTSNTKGYDTHCKDFLLSVYVCLSNQTL